MQWTAEKHGTDLQGKVRVSSDLARHVAWLQADFELGFERIFVYTISGQPERFIDAYGAKVLPAFRASGEPSSPF